MAKCGLETNKVLTLHASAVIDIIQVLMNCPVIKYILTQYKFELRGRHKKVPTQQGGEHPRSP